MHQSQVQEISVRKFQIFVSCAIHKSIDESQLIPNDMEGEDSVVHFSLEDETTPSEKKFFWQIGL